MNQVDSLSAPTEGLASGGAPRSAPALLELPGIGAIHPTIVDGVQSGIVIIDRDYRILLSNKFARDWAKRTAEEIRGQLCYRLFHNTEEVCSDCGAATTFQTGEPAQTRHAGLDKEGGLTYAEITTYPIKDDQGGVLYVIEHVQDVSDRVHFEQENASLMAALRKSEEEYRTMVELSNDLIWTLDSSGNFAWVNRRGEEVSGYRLEDWVGKSFAPLIVPEDLPLVQRMVAEALAGQPRNYEVRVRREDGSVFALLVNSAPIISNGEVTGIANFGKDITDRKQAEEQLLRRNNELEVVNAVAIEVGKSLDLNQILEASLDKVLEGMGLRPMGGIFLLDESRQQLHLAVHRGLPPDFVEQERRVKVGECLCGRVARAGRPLFSRDSRRDPRHTRLSAAASHSHLVVPLKAQGKTVGVMFLYPHQDYQVRRGDLRLLQSLGAQIGVAINNAQLYEREQVAIAEQRRLREQLHSHLHGVIRAREDERRTLARDLHDDTAQSLVAITRLLDGLGDMEPCGCTERLEEIRHLADEALGGVRRFAKELRPSIVDDLGLLPALDGLVAEMNRRSPVRTILQVRGQRRRLSGEAELMLFRICQEALNNVARHAEARSAVVEVEMSPNQARLTIVDDGKGFHPEEGGRNLVGEGKLGLVGMQERAELIKGALELHSSPGRGTRVSVYVPC